MPSHVISVKPPGRDADTDAVDAAVERDAHEFGSHVRMRGWRLGLLVARCVGPGVGQGRRTSAPSEQRLKVSAAAFARAAGVGRNTVAAYRDAWDAAATDGHVPPRDQLEPGVDMALDFEALPLWADYYTPPGRGWRSPTRGGDDEWYTVSDLVEAARRTLGGIDLDPASNATAQEVVQATRYFTAEEDGLAHQWTGRVFMNPPFSRANKFGKKLLRHFRAGDVEAAIMVANAYSAGALWARPFLSYPWCLITVPAFYKPGEPPSTALPVWPAAFYLGYNFDAFNESFEPLGVLQKDPTGREWEKRFSRPPGAVPAA